MKTELNKRSKALADMLYRLTEMQGDLVALGMRDAASLVAIAIGLVVESDADAIGHAPCDNVHHANGTATSGHDDDAGKDRARTGTERLH